MRILFSVVHASGDIGAHDCECLRGDGTVRLGIGTRLLILLDLALGITSSLVSTSYILFALSLILLYVILIFNASFRYHETIYLFVYSTIICVPFNLRLGLQFASILLAADVNSLHAWSLGIVASVVLSSVEEIVFCLIGYLIWGEQDVLQ